jgi:hypothetical protein
MLQIIIDEDSCRQELCDKVQRSCLTATQRRCHEMLSLYHKNYSI